MLIPYVGTLSCKLRSLVYHRISVSFTFLGFRIAGKQIMVVTSGDVAFPKQLMRQKMSDIYHRVCDAETTLKVCPVSLE